MNHSKFKRDTRGVSLIELMVALAIGAVLVLGLVEVFAASRTAYQLSTGLARVQENGRFAMDFLQRDLRMAGHLGCVNDQARFLPGSVTASRPALISTFLNDLDQKAANYGAAPAPLQFDSGIQGYDAKINGGGAATGSASAVTLTTLPTMAAGAGNWSPALPANLFTDLKGDATLTGDPVQNSDIVVLRFFTPIGAQVTQFTPGPTAIVRFNADQASRMNADVINPGLFGITDCLNAAVFEATSYVAGPAGGTGTIQVQATNANNSGFLGLQGFTIGQAMLYRAESVVYYIGRNASDNPSLYRIRYTLTPGADAPIPKREEMVEGVESLQLQYGLDSQLSVVSLPTGNIGRSELASAVDAIPDKTTAWRRVGLIQVGIVARSPDPAAAGQRDTSLTSVVALSPLGVKVTPPNDARYRAVYEDSIALRNRLFGN